MSCTWMSSLYFYLSCLVYYYILCNWICLFIFFVHCNLQLPYSVVNMNWYCFNGSFTIRYCMTCHSIYHFHVKNFQFYATMLSIFRHLLSDSNQKVIIMIIKIKCHEYFIPLNKASKNLFFCFWFLVFIH